MLALSPLHCSPLASFFWHTLHFFALDLLAAVQKLNSQVSSPWAPPSITASAFSSASGSWFCAASSSATLFSAAANFACSPVSLCSAFGLVPPAGPGPKAAAVFFQGAGVGERACPASAAPTLRGNPSFSSSTCGIPTSTPRFKRSLAKPHFWASSALTTFSPAFGKQV